LDPITNERIGRHLNLTNPSNHVSSQSSKTKHETKSGTAKSITDITTSNTTVTSDTLSPNDIRLFSQTKNKW